MAAFGAVGRFGAVGWREDLLLLTFPPASVALEAATYQPGSGQKVSVVPSDIVLGASAYVASGGTFVDAAAGDPLVVGPAPDLDAQAGASSSASGDALALGELASQVLTGATVLVSPAAIELEGPAYLAAAGVRIDFVLPAELALIEEAYSPQAGASAALVPEAPLVLEAVEFDVPAGNRIDVVPAPLDLEAVGFAAYAGVAIDFSLAPLALTEVAYAPGSGTFATFVPASEIVLEAPAYPARAGAQVTYRPPGTTYYVSAVGAAGVAGGPAELFFSALSLRRASYDPQSGASPALVPAAPIVLGELAFEIGARRKPVRGQFMMYN